MSKYYNPRKKRNLYPNDNGKPFKLSRSKIELFIQCPKCFYLDIKLGVRRPPGYPFSLNSAVDKLLKQEFDAHRVEGIQHPLMKSYGISAIPAAHIQLEQWRNNFKGIQYLDCDTNLLLYGAIDDLWIDGEGRYIVVDYKATSKAKNIIALDEEWQDGYKRQMEIYQWLLRKNGYFVSDTGYFVYCNGKKDLAAFDGKLEFDITLVPYTGSDQWIDETIRDLHSCLNSPIIPRSNEECDYCAYRQATQEVIIESHRKAI